MYIMYVVNKLILSFPFSYSVLAYHEYINANIEL